MVERHILSRRLLTLGRQNVCEKLITSIHGLKQETGGMSRCVSVLTVIQGVPEANVCVCITLCLHAYMRVSLFLTAHICSCVCWFSCMRR